MDDLKNYQEEASEPKAEAPATEENGYGNKAGIPAGEEKAYVIKAAVLNGKVDGSSSEGLGAETGQEESSPDDKYRLMDRVSGKLLEKISQAIDQLDIQMIRELRKDKEMIYDHPQRADKATKEILVERETLTTVRAPIDRNGIKLLAAALKDVKDIAMIRDPLDIREQEAKIAKLQQEAEGERDSGTLLVTFDSKAEALST